MSKKLSALRMLYKYGWHLTPNKTEWLRDEVVVKAMKAYKRQFNKNKISNKTNNT